MSVVVTCLDRATVAATVAIQLRGAVQRLQADPERVAQLCLTGGGTANEIYRQLAGTQEDFPGVDWSRVEIWWGEERFLPTESGERNVGQSLALLATSIHLDPSKVHPMPSSGSVTSDLRQAALHYATELGDTVFDICLLTLDGDGHVASLFPGHPSYDRRTTSRVVGVADSPKPPSERLSLTVPTINTSAEVWLVAAGADKADVVARAMKGDTSIPAGAVSGRVRTVWFLDIAAAAQLE